MQHMCLLQRSGAVVKDCNTMEVQSVIRLQFVRAKALFVLVALCVILFYCVFLPLYGFSTGFT